MIGLRLEAERERGDAEIGWRWNQMEEWMQDVVIRSRWNGEVCRWRIGEHCSWWYWIIGCGLKQVAMW